MSKILNIIDEIKEKPRKRALNADELNSHSAFFVRYW